MSELKNLLTVKSANHLSPETVDRVQAYLEPLKTTINCEILVLPQDIDAQLHNPNVHSAIDKLCDRIDKLVEVNQALLQYMIGLDQGVEAPQLGQHL